MFLYDAEAVQVVPKGLEVPSANENYPFTAFFSAVQACLTRTVVGVDRPARPRRPPRHASTRKSP